MRVAVVTVVLAGCTFDPSLGGDNDDTPGEDTRTITHDSAADFADPAELIDGVLIDGRIEPNAYVMGGLHVRSYANKLVDGITTFDSLDAAVANLTPLARSYGEPPAEYGQARPAGLAINSNDNYTLYFDGEIELQAGPRVLSIDADDAGILEVVIAGEKKFVVDATGGRKQLAVEVPQTGWYPVRLAMGEGGGNARFSLQIDTVPIAGTELRSRVTEERGLIGQLYEPAHATFLGATGIDGFDGNYGTNPPPFDFAPPDFGNYDYRMIGQIFIDVAGEWTFALAPDVDDTARLWIDEEHVASAWADGVVDGFSPSATVDLAVGWHDIFIDFRALQISPETAVSNPHAATLAVRAAPPGGAMAAIPTGQLRPVISSGLASAVLANNAALAIDTVTRVPLQLPPSATTIHSVEAGYALSPATNRNNYSVQLDTGTLIDVPPATGLDQFGLLFDDISLRGQPVPTAPWALVFTDNNADLVGGVAGLVFVDLVTRGGPAMPFSPTTSYTSKPIATPGAIRLGEVRVTGTLDGVTPRIAVRTAATADALVDQAFVELGTAAPGEFIQYQLVLASDGWQFPVIDKVELDYVVAE